MSAIVTPSDVDAVIDDTVAPEEADQATSSPPHSDPDKNPPPEDTPPVVPLTDQDAAPPQSSPEEAELDKAKRIDALLAKWVPNKAIWPQLRALETPKDIFTAGEMPFDERNFFSLCFWETTSIMLPYYGAMASVGGSIFVAFVTMISQQANDDETEYPTLSASAAVLPLVLGLVVFTTLHEYPCRAYIYHRLWEHKLAIDFKPRKLSNHRVTQWKMGFLALLLVGYLYFGYKEFNARASYFFVMLQTYGTIGWIIYSNLDMDKSLLPMNCAIRHAQPSEENCNRDKPQPPPIQASPGEEEKHNGDSPVIATAEIPCIASASLGDSVRQLRVISEGNIKRDILALQDCLSELKTTLARAKKASNTRLIACIEEEIKSLKVWATWIGRLGNTRETDQLAGKRKALFTRNELYMFSFLSNSKLFDDELWHRSGCFAHRSNKSGFTTKRLEASYCISLSMIVVIEVAAFLSFDPETELCKKYCEAP